MKVKHLFGPRSGSFEHLQPNVANTLISAGLAEAVPLAPWGSREWLRDRQEQSAASAPTLPAPAVKWSVGKGSLTGRVFITGQCTRENCGVFRYEGDEHGAAFAKFQHSCGAHAPESVPANVLREFGHQKTGEIPNMTHDEAVFYQERSRNAKDVKGSIGDHAPEHVSHKPPITFV